MSQPAGVRVERDGRLLPVTALGLVLFGFLVSVRADRFDRVWSDRLSSWAADHGLGRTLQVVEDVTDAPLWWGLGAVAVLVVRTWRFTLWALLAGALGGILTPVLKAVLSRDRPVLDVLLTDATGYSLPSGHVMSSTIGTGVVLAALLPRVRHRPLVVVPALLVLLVVGLDRVLIGAHWPTDVLAGWALGTAVLAGSGWAVRPAGRPSA